MTLYHNGIAIPSWGSVVFADELRRMAELTYPGDQPPSAIDVRWDDVGYYCIAAAGSHWLEFRVLKFNQFEADTVLFHKAEGGDGYTADANEAELLMAGNLKWDGCVNLDIGTDDGVKLHFCERRQATAVGVVLNRLYDLAAARVGHWMGEDEYDRPAWEALPK
jgi:hypothetical protein